MRNKDTRTFNHDYLVRRAQGLGLTQADLCRKLGVTSTPVSNWFNGKTNPKEKHINTLVAMGFRLSALVKSAGEVEHEEDDAKSLMLPPPQVVQKQLDTPALADLLLRDKADAVPADDMATVKALVQAAHQGNAWRMMKAIKEILEV